MILFVDTNIFLDVLLDRKLLAKSSAEILNKSAVPGYKLYTSAISFANLTYFVCKFRPSEAHFLLSQILNDIYIADTSTKDFEQALESGMKDLEDAYLYFTALRIRGLKYFITRNVKHFRKKDGFSVVTPEEFFEAEKKRT